MTPPPIRRSGANLVRESGADIFVLLDIADSRMTGATGTIVCDFETCVDLFVLTSIDADILTSGDQAFTFITGGFSGTAGELRVMENGDRFVLQGMSMATAARTLPSLSSETSRSRRISCYRSQRN